jgi:hypothetical protein
VVPCCGAWGVRPELLRDSNCKLSIHERDHIERCPSRSLRIRGLPLPTRLHRQSTGKSFGSLHSVFSGQSVYIAIFQTGLKKTTKHFSRDRIENLSDTKQYCQPFSLDIWSHEIRLNVCPC